MAANKNGALTLTSDDVNYLVYRYMQESGGQWCGGWRGRRGAGRRGGAAAPAAKGRWRVTRAIDAAFRLVAAATPPSR
jgi:hypothetical protein